MINLTFLNDIKSSFYDKNFYINSLKTSIKSRFKFIIIFLLLVNIISYVYYLYNVKYYINLLDNAVHKEHDSNINLIQIIDQIPKIKIDKNGNISVDTATPYYIKSDNKNIAIIDTSGQIDSLEGIEENILITKTQLIYRFPGSKQTIKKRIDEIFEIRDSYIIDKALIMNAIKSVVQKKNTIYRMTILVFPLVFIIAIISYLMNSVILSIIAKIFLLGKKYDLAFIDLLTIAVYSRIPSYTIDTLAKFANFIPIGVIQILSMIMSVGYFIFAIRAITNNNNIQNKTIDYNQT